MLVANTKGKDGWHWPGRRRDKARMRRKAKLTIFHERKQTRKILNSHSDAGRQGSAPVQSLPSSRWPSRAVPPPGRRVAAAVNWDTARRESGLARRRRIVILALRGTKRPPPRFTSSDPCARFAFWFPDRQGSSRGTRREAGRSASPGLVSSNRPRLRASGRADRKVQP
jgi:hypothetical protein